MKHICRLSLLALSLCLPSFACTDFSGSWKGSCKTEGSDELQDDAVEILQTGCETLTLGNEKFEFGKETSYVETLESHDEKIAAKADWNAAKTAFAITYSVIGTAKGTGATLFTVKGTLNETLVDGQLVSRLHEEQTTAGSPTEAIKITCAYRKPGL